MSSNAQENVLITALPIKLLVAPKWKELPLISFKVKKKKKEVSSRGKRTACVIRLSAALVLDVTE